MLSLDAFVFIAGLITAGMLIKWPQLKYVELDRPKIKLDENWEHVPDKIERKD